MHRRPVRLRRRPAARVGLWCLLICVGAAACASGNETPAPPAATTSSTTTTAPVTTLATLTPTSVASTTTTLPAVSADVAVVFAPVFGEEHQELAVTATAPADLGPVRIHLADPGGAGPGTDVPMERDDDLALWTGTIPAELVTPPNVTWTVVAGDGARARRSAGVDVPVIPAGTTIEIPDGGLRAETLYEAPWGDSDGELRRGSVSSLVYDDRHDRLDLLEYLDIGQWRIISPGPDGQLTTVATPLADSVVNDLVLDPATGVLLTPGFKVQGRDLHLQIQELPDGTPAQLLLDDVVPRMTIVNTPVLSDATTGTLWLHDGARAVPLAGLDPPRLLPATTTLPWLGARVAGNEQFVITMGDAQLHLRAPATVHAVRQVSPGGDGTIWFAIDTDRPDGLFFPTLVRVDLTTRTAASYALPTGPFGDDTRWYTVHGPDAYTMTGGPQGATVLHFTAP